MKLISVGSSSKGNAYILESSRSILLLEAGVRFREVSKFINPEKNIVGLCASHGHSDHLGFADQYLKRCGCTLYGNKTVTDKMADFDTKTMVEGKSYIIGEFTVCPFAVYHDTETFGFLIHHKECGTICMATDTFAMPVAMTNCDIYMIEANYSDAILEDNLSNGEVSFHEAKRLMTSHFSIDNCIRFLKESHAEAAKAIILLHLSARNSNEKLFKDMVQYSLGTPTYVAKKSFTLDISKI